MSERTVALRKQDYAYAKMKEAILSGRMAPGSRPNYQDLAATLEVSSAPLRQAFDRLLREGLLVHQPHRPWRVAPLTRNNLRDVYASRESLERLLTAEAGDHLKEADLAEIRQIYQLHREAVETDDHEGAVKYDGLFHDRIFQAAGFPQTLKMQQNLRMLSERYIRIFMGDRRRVISSVDDHRKILEALSSGSIHEAAERAGDHVARGYKVLDSVLALRDKRDGSES